MITKKLLRSNNDRIIAGVCAGLAEYLVIDTWLIRTFAILLVMLNGLGLILYIIGWVVIPEKSDKNSIKESEVIVDGSNKAQLGIGLFLILLGVIFLINNFFPWLSFWKLWPVLLIFAGIIMLVRKHGSEN